MTNKKFGIRYTTDSYIDKANEIHNNLFDYSLTEYKNSYTKIKIICHIHGVFEQQPGAHINQKQGCPKCSHNFAWTHDRYVNKSKEQFRDKFEIVSQFTGMKHPITIKCKDHGIFETTGEAHLNGDGRCPTCWYNTRLENLKAGNVSKIESSWLDSMNVPLRQHTLIIDSKTFVVDGFDPSTNTVYECYGSYWHGNPAKYNPTDINPRIGKTFGELYARTMLKEELIKRYYSLVTIWVP